MRSVSHAAVGQCIAPFRKGTNALYDRVARESRNVKINSLVDLLIPTCIRHKFTKPRDDASYTHERIANDSKPENSSELKLRCTVQAYTGRNAYRNVTALLYLRRQRSLRCSCTRRTSMSLGKLNKTA